MGKTVQREIRESVAQGKLQVDASAGVVPRVRVLGWVSANKRRYTPEAGRAGLPLYSKARVNLDHPANPSAIRGIRDRFGVLLDPVVESSGIYARLVFNPSHEFAETFVWWCQNDPGAIGLSHNAIGQGHDEDGVFVVEKILDVRSVDLVADPATNPNGLLEGRNQNMRRKTRECDNDGNGLDSMFGRESPTGKRRPMDEDDEGGSGAGELNRKVNDLIAAGVPADDIMAALDQLMQDGGPRPGKVAGQLDEALSRVRQRKRLDESVGYDDFVRAVKGGHIRNPHLREALAQSERRGKRKEQGRQTAQERRLTEGQSRAAASGVGYDDFVRTLKRGL